MKIKSLVLIKSMILITFSRELNLDIIGLMCIPPANEDPDKYFKEIKLLNKKFDFLN